MDQATVTTIVTALAGLATTIITGIVAPLVLAQLKIAEGKLNEQARAIVLPALQYAIAYAQAQVAKTAAPDPTNVLKAVDLAKQIALDYLKTKVQTQLDRLNLTDANLLEMLEARLHLATPPPVVVATPA